MAWTPPTLGQLKAKLELQSPSSAKDTSDAPNPTWTTQATVRGRVSDMTARQYFAAMATESERGVTVVIWYRADIGPDWRVKWGTRYFRLDGPPIDPDERKVWLELQCREGVD